MNFSSTRISPNRRALGDSSPLAGVTVVCATLARAVTTPGPPLGWRGGFGPRLKWLTTLGSRLKWLTVPSSKGDRGIERAGGAARLKPHNTRRFDDGSHRIGRGHDPTIGQFLATRRTPTQLDRTVRAGYGE